VNAQNTHAHTLCTLSDAAAKEEEAVVVVVVAAAVVAAAAAAAAAAAMEVVEVVEAVAAAAVVTDADTDIAGDAWRRPQAEVADKAHAGPAGKSSTEELPSSARDARALGLVDAEYGRQQQQQQQQQQTKPVVTKPEAAVVVAGW
jgi:hypothetical protein